METINKGVTECEKKTRISLEDLYANLKRVFQRMASIGSSAIRRHGSSLLHTLQQYTIAVILRSREHLWLPLRKKLKEMETKMIGPIEKGIEAAKFSKPIEGVYDGIDLKVLPKYISYRAALLHNKLTLQYIILILSVAFAGHYFFSRFEVHSLYKKLREKEYILAPGVLDFTAASPQAVPDSYVASAVTDFLGQLGNVTSGNIEEQYTALSDSMSPQLRVRFLSEATEWKAKVKAENISELLTVTEKEIRSTNDGYYRAMALARRDTYINNEYLGHVDEAIEMVIQLVPPKSGKRWYLQINSLSREKADTFRARKGL